MRPLTVDARLPATCFVTRAALTAAVAWAFEVAWTIRIVTRGAVWLVPALFGANLVVALGLVAVVTMTAALVERGWALAARRERARERPRVARLAVSFVGGTLTVLGAAVLLEVVVRAHSFAAASIRTTGFRGPVVALVAVAVAAAIVAVGPGLLDLSLRRLRSAHPRAQLAAASMAALAWVAAVVLVARALAPIVTEIDPPIIASLTSWTVSFLVGWLGGPGLARRLSGRAAAVLSLLLVLALAGSATLLAKRRVLRAAITSSALGSRHLAELFSTASTAKAAPPGPITRLFPLGREAPPPRAVARHVILVTIDALRYDRAFPPAGSALARRDLMPRLASFAGRGVRFDAAFCTVPGSLRAVPSILTGRYQNALALRRPAHVALDPTRSKSLAEMLAGAGFDTVFAPHTRYVMSPGTTQGFAKVIDPVLLPEADRRRKMPRDVPMVEATLRALEQRRAPSSPLSDRRLFLWSHFIDPHAPYWDHSPFGHGDVDRYDGEVAGSDRALGLLLDGLRRLGVLDDALVVVTADHGEEFREHGSTRHSRTLWDAAVRVPLVIAGPGVRPRRVADPVSHIDLVPTILPLLGLPAPRGLDGRSLARTVLEGARPPVRTVIVVAYPMIEPRPALYAAIRGDRKLVTDAAGVATGVYDYRRDPLEQGNLLDETPAAALRALEADVSRYRARGLGEASR